MSFGYRNDGNWAYKKGVNVKTTKAAVLGLEDKIKVTITWD